MKAPDKKTWKLIGFIALIVLFSVISVFFLLMLYESNTIFLSETTEKIKEGISTSDLLFYIIGGITVLLAGFTIFMRKNKLCSVLSLIIAFLLSLAGAIVFAIQLDRFGVWGLGLDGLNLYAVYFFFVLLSNAFPIFFSIRSLMKLKHAPVTFQKSDQT